MTSIALAIGIVEGGFSSALMPGRSARRQVSGNADLMPFAKPLRVLHVMPPGVYTYPACCNVARQAERMW